MAACATSKSDFTSYFWVGKKGDRQTIEYFILSLAPTAEAAHIIQRLETFPSGT